MGCENQASYSESCFEGDLGLASTIAVCCNRLYPTYSFLLQFRQCFALALFARLARIRPRLALRGGCDAVGHSEDRSQARPQSPHLCCCVDRARVCPDRQGYPTSSPCGL